MHNSVGLCWCRARTGDTCLVLLTDHSIETLPSIRHVSYPAPHSLVTVEGTTFFSAMVYSHTTRSIALSVSWHTDAHKYDRGHMDARHGYSQALLRKQSYMCDKWIVGFSISWVWCHCRNDCTVLCLLTLSCTIYSIYLFNWIFSWYPKNN